MRPRYGGNGHWPTFDITSQRSKTTTGASSTFFTPRWVRLWEWRVERYVTNWSAKQLSSNVKLSAAEGAEAKVELDREREELRAAAASAERLHHDSELESLRCEVVLLRGEFGVDRGLAALHDEVVTDRSEVPKFEELEARVAAEQIRRRQRGLERELAATKARLGKMRVAQSAADYRLSEHIREQQPVVELKFECADSRFIMRDLHRDAAAAWRRFVAEMVQANDCDVSANDPSGRVVALPSRGAA